ncbi:MAG: FAD-dependent oxidoreductase, partial [Chloroflexota bacterium]
LASRGIDAVLLEAEPDVGEGASKANSAIIHTGFDAKPGTIEATLLRRAAERWPSLLETHRVPSLRCGALMLATSDEDAGRLRGVADLAATHGVTTDILDRAALEAIAPYVTPDAVAALDVPDESIVDPFWLTRAYAEAALALGARVETRARVVALDVTPDGVEIELADGRQFAADQAFDAAGVRADDVARLAGDDSFTLTPRKGQFLVSERTYDVDRIVLPIPGPLGKGMLVTPIVFGGVLLGPTAEDGDDKSDRSTDEVARRRILEATTRLVPDVERMDPIRSFAGVRAVSSTGDYIIQPSTAGDRLTIVAGIRSTGISASPAIAEAAVELAAESRGWNRGLPRRDASPTPELAADAGAVVCVCRSVGAAEVDAALVGPLPPSTTDGLKRRAGVGFGDCQGNRCLAEAIERVAAARGVAAERVEKGRAGSWLVAARAARSAASTDDRHGSPATELDVIVVGAGLAGIAAALAAANAGRDVCLVERTTRAGGAIAALPRTYMRDDETATVRDFEAALDARRVAWLPATTVVGLEPDGGDWRVDALSAHGAVALTARAVVLATGGYLTPREHVGIDGPRPSGVMTADFALDALDRGWRPGTTAVVVGDGRIADGTADRLSTAGVRVVARRAVRVDAIRGETRVEAIHVDGEWVAADTLVLAQAMRPASFLLRGLGIGDERPGVAMPADTRGALPLGGLWAAGTCVSPDVDHGSSVAAGRAVGAAVAEALAASSVDREPVGR